MVKAVDIQKYGSFCLDLSYLFRAMLSKALPW